MRDERAGFSLVEVLVAALIMALTLMFLARLFMTGMKYNAVAKEDTIMAAFAQDKLEQLKKLPKTTIDSLFATACTAACTHCVCGTTGCSDQACCPVACYPSGCADDATTWTRGATANRVYRDWEDPIPDPNPGDVVKENLYVRYWEIRKVTIGDPVGCVFKYTVIVGSRGGFLARAPSSAVNWARADWREVTGLPPYDADPSKRRVVVATYRSL